MEATTALPHTSRAVSELVWQPLPSSLPHGSTASPGSGSGRQLPVCRQSRRTCKPSVGKAEPSSQMPTRRFGCQLYHLAMSLGGGIKHRVASPSLVAKWERGKCLFLSSHQCCSWWPAPQMCSFLNGSLLFMFWFSPTSENLTEMRFWAFTSLSVLFCNVPRKLGRKIHIAIFVLFQFSFAVDFEKKLGSFPSPLAADMSK